MANLKITVPDMGDFKDVEVIEVLVKEGQSIDKNESIITLESDKSSVEVPSTHSGKVDKISIAVGDKINKGDLILTLESSEKKEEEKKVQTLKNLKNTNLSFIRIACHFDEVFKIEKYIKILKKNKKINLFVNIMQISEINSKSIFKICHYSKKFSNVCT